MTRCRVVKAFPWRGCQYAIGREVNPGAELRKQWLRRGLIEVIGEEAVAAKEQKTQAEDVAPTPARKAGRPKKAAIA